MAAQNFLLHVHVSTDLVRKMTLSSRPESVDDLKIMIKEKFKLDFDFSLSYEDPDFDGQLCSLVDIEELPQKAVVKAIRIESDDSSVASDDTIILPHAMTPERAERWNEFILSEGNATYVRTGKTLKFSRGCKAYPSDREVSVVAEALVTKHPCLKEPGSQTGWYGWKNSLKFKIGNYRTKLKVNFLPNYPRGEDTTSLEQLRLQIVDEVKMSDKNLVHITKLMQTTFALRRKEVVNDDLPVAEILERWPALKIICAEFHRITNMNLKNCFYAVLDRHSPHLHNLFRKKAALTGKVSEVLGQLFRIYDLQVRGLHFLMPEKDTASDDPDIDDIPLRLLSVGANSRDVTFFCPEKIAVVVEGNIVINVPIMAHACVMLFALIYALHLSYPKELSNTFDFIQKVLMGLEDGKLRPRVLSLKNDLLAME
uniref:PB1 domain-containing protein n=1 Tax=Amphiprion percula TaxID=161767 RepID=A0A3P8SW13_AMPPE